MAEPPERWTATHGPAAGAFAKYRAAAADTGAFDACGLPTGGHYDELVDGAGRLRESWSELSADFLEQGRDGLRRIDERVRRLIEDDGITYTERTAAEEPATPSPWRLDPIPLLVSDTDWATLEAGVVQRSRLLDAILADVYGPRRTITSGLLPPRIVFGHSGYMRAAHGISLPGRHQLFLHACDISRWSDGAFRVLADWAQAPSGAGYALADRRVVSAAIPEAFELASPRPLTPFVRAMRLMLIEAAPRAADEEPVVVVLSPGVHSETAFDQAYLASVLGFPLVESADLVVRDGYLWMRSLGTLKRVDVVLRRVDAEFSDPLDLRPDSQLGVVGLVEALRRGAVTVVNTLGSGVLESPALAAHLPRLSRALLDEDLKLPGVQTYWGGDDIERSHLTAQLHRLILRSTEDGTTVFGPLLARAQLAEWRARIDVEGWRWAGQEPARFSVAPAVADRGELAAAPVEFRLFSLAGRVGYRVMGGGLGQLHQRTGPDGMIREAAAKDIWVHAAPAPVPAVDVPDERERRAPAVPTLEVVSPPRVLNDFFWLGRYAERAEVTVRLVCAIHDRYQDYRYRPWMEGAEAMPVLIAALGNLTGSPPPPPRKRPTPAASTPHEPSSIPGEAASKTPESETNPPSAMDPPEPATSPPVSAIDLPGSATSPPGSASRERDTATTDAATNTSTGCYQQQFAGEHLGDYASQSQDVAGQRQEARGAPQPPSGSDADPWRKPQMGSDQGQNSGGQQQSSGGEQQRGAAGRRAMRRREYSDEPTVPITLPGASRRDHDYLLALTVDRELPGSLAYAMDRYAKVARAVRDRLSPDTWMILGSVDRALSEYRAARGDRGAALAAVHSRALSALLSLAGIDAESVVRDTGWYVMDIGRRIERGLALTALLRGALCETYPAETDRVVIDAVLSATVSSVTYRRRHRDSLRISAVAGLLLFDASNPRSLAHQLERMEADFFALPATSGSSRPQRLLTDAQRMLRRVDPADLETADQEGVRTELVELLDGVHLRLRKIAESFEATRLSVPREMQPLWGSARVVG
ncbi:circularly permuted type 2 ATP-grasp protein [Nocardia sp. 2]|uniref:Circularly permuted type 2 ATP-grasp protein n=2 Tax=Nocardia acididurans TaxID=2802282 RepID=A0ABS1LZ69_9NOCA|nr:circularly permuted type 2 ATP-grasp protein [Nocardia acididurans]MBL1073516.1 circularly permuted type 2 ATP-grasp protein [Nocardia acididurans]